MKVMVKGREFRVTPRQAETLVKIGRGTYLTRDMQAQAPAVEMDVNGDEWSEELHTSTKLKNKDGSWRKKPGAAKPDEE